MRRRIAINKSQHAILNKMKSCLRPTGTAMILTLLVISMSGCEKDNSNKPDTFEVKYEVVPMNKYMIHFIYNDESQHAVDLNDLNQFSDGIKKVTVSSKPFTAKLRIVINNTSLVPISGLLQVSVDGEVKKKEPLDASPAARSETEIEYTIR